MDKFYNNSVIYEILKIFKIKEIIISGVTDETLIENIFNYDANITLINGGSDDSIKGNPLHILPNLENYDAIFLDDDSNWFTVYNELQIIKKSNEKFPLVFICNNNFPNKRRDSYSNPDKIPSKFRQEYISEFPVCYDNEKIIINDGFYHACDENTPKNGVFTAIEDFLNENSHIGIMNINLVKEITILYLKIPINKKRISIITKNIQNHETLINFSEKLIENQLLFSYINNYNLYNAGLNDFEVEISKKNTIIDDYKHEIDNKNNEISFKEIQLNGFESKVSLKESQIKNFESKLINKNNKIHNLKNELQVAKKELISLNQKLNDKNFELNEIMEKFKHLESNYNNQFSSLVLEFNQKESDYVNEINSLSDVYNQKESNYINKINSLNNVLNQMEFNYENKINSMSDEFKQKEQDYHDKINSLTNEINLKNQNLINDKNEYDKYISIKNTQIDSLKNNLIQNESLYSKKEDELNNYICSKDVEIQQKVKQIRIKQQELDEQEKKLDCLQESFIKQLNKIEANEYCITCFKEELSNNHIEITYLKNNPFIKKILNPFAYLYLIFKSNSNEISLNIKLYKVLKNSNCFDIGFYLNKNKDLLESEWCKYFSPELHYVCKGFDEDRKFNKKYFNRKSKKDLLEYLLICDK